MVASETGTRGLINKTKIFEDIARSVPQSNILETVVNFSTNIAQYAQKAAVEGISDEIAIARNTSETGADYLNKLEQIKKDNPISSKVAFSTLNRATKYAAGLDAQRAAADQKADEQVFFSDMLSMSQSYPDYDSFEKDARGMVGKYRSDNTVSLGFGTAFEKQLQRVKNSFNARKSIVNQTQIKDNLRTVFEEIYQDFSPQNFSVEYGDVLKNGAETGIDSKQTRDMAVEALKRSTVSPKDLETIADTLKLTKREKEITQSMITSNRSRLSSINGSRFATAEQNIYKQTTALGQRVDDYEYVNPEYLRDQKFVNTNYALLNSTVNPNYKEGGQTVLEQKKSLTIKDKLIYIDDLLPDANEAGKNKFAEILQNQMRLAEQDPIKFAEIFLPDQRDLISVASEYKPYTLDEKTGEFAVNSKGEFVGVGDYLNSVSAKIELASAVEDIAGKGTVGTIYSKADEGRYLSLYNKASSSAKEYLTHNHYNMLKTSSLKANAPAIMEAMTGDNMSYKLGELGMINPQTSSIIFRQKQLADDPSQSEFQTKRRTEAVNDIIRITKGNYLDDQEGVVDLGRFGIPNNKVSTPTSIMEITDYSKTGHPDLYFMKLPGGKKTTKDIVNTKMKSNNNILNLQINGFNKKYTIDDFINKNKAFLGKHKFENVDTSVTLKEGTLGTYQFSIQYLKLEKGKPTNQVMTRTFEIDTTD